MSKSPSTPSAPTPPSGTNGLRALVTAPTATTNWHGPYLNEIPKDPWGHEYIYACPGKHSSYDLYSLGPGKNSPIANWEHPSLRP
ncbi:MAG: hypothetical protein C5B50_26960 [Verrucomicrobia bacterium]|nr:MAG: hypothetical protein C5B50_26960 [Verrucomicrobiota bacterium]